MFGSQLTLTLYVVVLCLAVPRPSLCLSHFHWIGFDVDHTLISYLPATTSFLYHRAIQHMRMDMTGAVRVPMCPPVFGGLGGHAGSAVGFAPATVGVSSGVGRARPSPSAGPVQGAGAAVSPISSAAVGALGVSGRGLLGGVASGGSSSAASSPNPASGSGGGPTTEHVVTVSMAALFEEDYPFQHRFARSGAMTCSMPPAFPLY